MTSYSPLLTNSVIISTKVAGDKKVVAAQWHAVNGPCLLDYLILQLRLPVVLYVSFAVDSR